MLAPPVGGDQTKYQLVYPRLYALAGGLVPTPWSFWGQMQFLPNFVFALAFAASGDVLARLLNGAMGVAAVLALATLVGARLAPRAGAIAGALFFTLPITWSLMTHAGVDLAVVLYTALGTAAFLAWAAEGRAGDLRRAALMAGLAGGSKLMGLLVPALLGAALLGVLAWRAEPGRRLVRAGLALGFAPALLLVRRRRFAVLATAAIGLGYAGIVASAAWAHPRYVVPGAALLLVAAVPAARALLPRRLFAAAVALTLAGNLALT